MSVGYFVLGKPLEFCQDRPITLLCFSQYLARGIKILCRRGCFHCFGTPADPCMPKKITGRVSITFVKKSNNVAAIAPFATTSRTFKDMTTPFTLVLDLRGFFKEDIDW